MAGKKSTKTAGPKARARRTTTRHPANKLFERVVSIPEIAVFSELPFARQGVIGGKEIAAHHNQVPSNPTAVSLKKNRAVRKAASTKLKRKK